MVQSIRSRLNKIVRDNISNKIHISIDDEIVCGQKRPCHENSLKEWLTKGDLRCQKCVNKYKNISNQSKINPILKRINFLSKLALRFDYLNYLEENKKKLIIFQINLLHNNYSIIHGDNSENLIEQANTNFVVSQAGYLYNICSRLKFSENADLFLISDNVLKSNSNEIDTIIIHELVHFLIDSGNSNFKNISEEAKEIGNNIYNLTDSFNEIESKHTIEYCHILSQACINYNAKTQKFSDSEITLKSSMRFDIFE
ncbi:MAG: hypothetical protein WCH34_00905 [Bacteroidota bacterium]